MKRPRVLKLRRVKSIFASFGIAAERAKTSGHRRKRHWILMAEDGTKFPIPGHGEKADISRAYVEAARRAFGLTPDDGVSDEDFYSRR